MNMRSLTVILGALSVFALGACTVTSTTSGSGGGTTATGTGGEAAGVGGAGGATSTATGTSTGTAMCDMTYTCAEAITPPDNDPSKLCDGPSGDAYDAYYTCICETVGACGKVCGAAYCTGTAPTAECTTCLQDSSEKGCAKVVEACQNDI
ncbi:MAG: hypothetical protein ABI134_26875 [Byssovorax sp.]